MELRCKRAGEILLHTHPLEAESVFLPEDLMRAVREQRRLGELFLPRVCVLDFDGDLTDMLVNAGDVEPCRGWACFHSTMWALRVDGQECGIIPRTIGGPYAVLVAEQLAVSGVKVVLGLTSAGRVAPQLPVPGIVVVDQAIRDEGTSYHYIPAAESVEAWPEVSNALEAALASLSVPVVRGLVWTTDAPYRETAQQMEHYAERGVLAVEMQAASLLAFSRRKGMCVGIVAQVTNAPDHNGEAFDKGSRHSQRELLLAVCRAGIRLATLEPGGTDQQFTRHKRCSF